jgi:hypothetical protein
MPLYALTHAKPLSELVRGLIDIYRNEGYMPDCYMGLGPGFTQGGSNAEMPLVDFLLKHGKDFGDISWKDGFDAMIKDATVVSRRYLQPEHVIYSIVTLPSIYRNRHIKVQLYMEEAMLCSTMSMDMFQHRMDLPGIILRIRLDQHPELWNMLVMILQ